MAPAARKQWKRGPRIGKGVFATIFLAVNMENGKKFVVKSADKSNLTQRLSLEVERRLLRECKSPYVLKYLGCDTTDRVKEMQGLNTFNLMLELVPRGSILDHIRHSGDGLLEETVAAYTRDILKGLSYLHSRGIVHGDIKAENCLIGRENVKLCDLGSGKFIADGDLPLEPRPGQDENRTRIYTTGTRGWQAREVEEEREQGPPSDIYSLGCTIVEMCTGRPPMTFFPDEGKDIFCFDIPSSYSADCHDFLTLCLQEDPRKRPSASDLLRHAWFSRSPCIYPVDRKHLTSPGKQTAIIKKGFDKSFGFFGCSKLLGCRS